MATARMRAAWDQTALLAMLIAEPNRNEEARPQPYTPATFHPYMDEAESEAQRPHDVMAYDPAILEGLAKGNA